MNIKHFSYHVYVYSTLRKLTNLVHAYDKFNEIKNTWYF